MQNAPKPPHREVTFSDRWLSAAELRAMVVSEMAKNMWGIGLMADKARCDRHDLTAFLMGHKQAPKALAEFLGFHRANAYVRSA